MKYTNILMCIIKFCSRLKFEKHTVSVTNTICLTFYQRYINALCHNYRRMYSISKCENFVDTGKESLSTLILKDACFFTALCIVTNWPNIYLL